MRSLFFALVAAGTANIAASANAGVFTDDLSRCMVTKASKADSSTFMAWMFSAISSDPELQKLTTLDRAKRDKIGSDAAHVFQRLLLLDCRKEALAALKAEGEDSLIPSFGALGRAATEQMFRSPEAQAELESLGSNFNEQSLEALFREAGIPVKAEK